MEKRMDSHALISGSLNKILAAVALILAVGGKSALAYTTPYKPTEWARAHATFYGDLGEAMGGACGYRNLYGTGYEAHTTALSTTLFDKGYACGQCFELRCVDSPNCQSYYGSSSVVVTATNLCPPNWYQDSNNGGWCNPPRKHFDLCKPAFTKLAYYKAGIIPVEYRRVSCQRTGGIRFRFQGNAYWLLVFVMNVGGSGDVGRVWVKGTKTGWIPMSHNWGASYQAFEQLGGQSLSFALTSYTTRQMIVAWNVAPANWYVGGTYQSDVNFN